MRKSVQRTMECHILVPTILLVDGFKSPRVICPSRARVLGRHWYLTGRVQSTESTCTLRAFILLRSILPSNTHRHLAGVLLPSIRIPPVQHFTRVSQPGHTYRCQPFRLVGRPECLVDRSIPECSFPFFIGGWVWSGGWLFCQSRFFRCCFSEGRWGSDVREVCWVSRFDHVVCDQDGSLLVSPMP